MALMIDIKPAKYKGEAVVWEALSEKLPNDIVVYNHREIVPDREFDFALLIKELGILVIEVKGWQAQYIFDVNNPDEIIMQGEEKPLKSPEKQARGYRFDWLNFLEDRFSISPVVLSMVCYPFLSEKEYFQKRLDIVSARETTLFAEDLKDAGRLGKKIYALFSRKKFLNSSPMDISAVSMIRQYFEPSYKIREKDDSNVLEQYSVLQVFGRNLLEEDIQSLLKTYFSGTKMILFLKEERDLKKFSDSLCAELRKRNLISDKEKLRMSNSSEVQQSFSIQGGGLRIFNLEAYVFPDCEYMPENFALMEGNRIKEKADILGSLSEHTGFNFEQYKVEHAPTDANILVEAGAGTGKTHSMVSRIAFLCNRRNTTVHHIAEEIAMVTFTNEAADNMKVRLKQYFMNCYMLTRKARYLHQIEAVDLMQISTIHKFAKSVIQSAAISYGLGYDFGISSSEFAKGQVYEKYLNDFLVKKQNTEPNFAQRLRMPVHKFRKLLMKFTTKLYDKSYSITELQNSDLGTFEEWPFFNEVIREVIIPAELEYESTVFSKNKLDLKESMVLLNHAVNGTFRDKCDLKFKYIFIDEFQDTDDIQIDSFLKLQNIMSDMRFFVVGDLKQSIYRFRGATISAFDLIQKGAVKWDRPYTLTTNYRTDAGLLQKFDAIFTRLGNQKKLPFRPGIDTLKSSIDGHLAESELITKVEFCGEQMRMECLFSEIEKQKKMIAQLGQENELRKEEKIIAILVRENWQIHAILEESKKRGKFIETEVGGDLFQLAPAIDLYKLVLALLNPIEPVYLYNLVASNYVGIHLDIQGLHGMEKEKKTERLTEVLDKFFLDIYGKSWTEVIKETRTLPVLMLLRNLYEALQPWKNYEENEDGQRFYKANYELVLEKIIKMYSVDYLTLNTMGNSLHINILTGQEELARNVETRTDDIRVICITVHKAKGLEYGTVIMPYMNADISSMKKADLDVYIEKGKLSYGIKIGKGWDKKYNSNYDISQEETEKVNEETRVLYVALTRAIRNVVWFQDRNAKSKVSWQILMED